MKLKGANETSGPDGSIPKSILEEALVMFQRTIDNDHKRRSPLPHPVGERDDFASLMAQNLLPFQTFSSLACSVLHRSFPCSGQVIRGYRRNLLM